MTEKCFSELTYAIKKIEEKVFNSQSVLSAIVFSRPCGEEGERCAWGEPPQQLGGHESTVPSQPPLQLYTIHGHL